MTEVLVYGAALMMGLLSAPHCVGMCGGLVSALVLGSGRSTEVERLVLVLKLNAGRIVTYTLLGVLAGSFGDLVQQYLPQSQSGFRVFAGLLLVASGCYIGGWWMGLRHFEAFVGKIWQKLKSLTKFNHRAGIFAGITWGCLPCGLVYSALSIAMSQSAGLKGGLFMLCFGLGTAPVLIGVGLMSASFARWLAKTWIRGGFGMLLVCYGLWTMAGPWLAMSGRQGV